MARLIASLAVALALAGCESNPCEHSKCGSDCCLRDQIVGKSLACAQHGQCDAAGTCVDPAEAPKPLCQ